MQSFAAWLGFALALLCATHAHAQESVRLHFMACDDLAEDEVRRIARIELGATPMPAQLEIRCMADLVQLRASHGTVSAGKSVSVADVEPDSRPRLLALASAELVHELERLSKLPPTPPAAHPLPAPPPPERVRLAAGLLALVPLRSPLLGLGAELAVGVPIGAMLSLTMSGEFATGAKDISGGRLRYDTLGLLLGLRAERRLPRVLVHLELAVQGHRDSLEGLPQNQRRYEGESFRAFVPGLRLGMGLDVPFRKRGLFGLSLAGAYKTRTLYARNEGHPTSQVGPFFAAASLRVGARFP